ncbi:hypothetical protein GCM10010974_37050 [Brevibacterium sediminis]|uniref:Uncharacterized protein n=1 Tax=Brevibacterium sediminis TaxID=1857024 RepID=A0ABQ1N5G8_9MICO|nr:hypothetical protein [Brevibacterium sediminis]GGC51572.1 hypothetical protein GCM10010974_37050 [Brevibacterium sediminis]
MMTNEAQPGVEVPEPDWSEQLIDVAAHIDDDGNEDTEPRMGAIREADAGDVADQSIVVEVDDEDG